MAKLPGLFRRSGIFYIRVVVPTDLRSCYGGRTKIVRTLNTNVLAYAKAMGAQRRSETLLEFLRLREPEQRLPTCQSMLTAHPCNVGSRTEVIPSSTAKSRTSLRQVHARWTASQTRSADSVNACLRAVVLFEEFVGDVPVEELDRDRGDAFRAWLLEPERGTTSKTARDRLTWVKSLLKYATRDLELVGRSPWEGLDITAKTSQKRRPWTDIELRTFFNRPLFQQYELPTDTKAGRDAAFWIPLLGLFTGARVGELAQLRKQDVAATEIPHLIVTDEGEGQQVKSDAGHRRVPLHSFLLGLGFLQYVERVPGPPTSSLWPALPLRDGKPGGYFSHWFGEERRRVGFGRYPDFHCARHTVRSQLAEADLPEPLIDSLLGHEVKGSLGAKVYTHRSMKALQRAVEVLSYPALCLPVNTASTSPIAADSPLQPA